MTLIYINGALLLPKISLTDEEVRMQEVAQRIEAVFGPVAETVHVSRPRTGPMDLVILRAVCRHKDHLCTAERVMQPEWLESPHRTVIIEDAVQSLKAQHDHFVALTPPPPTVEEDFYGSD
jgi:hypothetical protein